MVIAVAESVIINQELPMRAMNLPILVTAMALLATGHLTHEPTETEEEVRQRLNRLRAENAARQAAAKVEYEKAAAPIREERARRKLANWKKRHG